MQTPPVPPYHYLLPNFESVSCAPYTSFHDEVRTLFVAGLPGDVKYREIYNLFREFPGYESCQLRSSGRSSQAFAFAVFTDQQSAIAAMNALNGLIFDLETDLALHIDLAKSNSRSKRLRADDGLSSNGNKARDSSMHHQGIRRKSYLPVKGHDINCYTSTQRNFSHEAIEDPEKELPTAVSQNNVPCPTLFVANLGSGCSEEELTQLFSSYPGFVKLKMQNRNGVHAAFVDFQDITCSTRALNNLQGYVLYSSDIEGMRLEYAKSRMGTRKHERK